MLIKTADWDLFSQPAVFSFNRHVRYASARWCIKTHRSAAPAPINSNADTPLAADNMANAIVAKRPPIERPIPHFWIGVKLANEARNPSANKSDPTNEIRPKMMCPKINPLNILFPLSDKQFAAFRSWCANGLRLDDRSSGHSTRDQHPSLCAENRVNTLLLYVRW